MTDLDKLIVAVSENWISTDLLMAAVEHPLDMIALAAFDGDVNAALALVEALLTKDCHWSLSECDDRGYVARIFFNGWHQAESTVPGRALLLATLRAVRAKG